MGKTGIDLERIVFIGRTYEEYMAMFALSMDEMRSKKILDCPSGACSFTAIANQSGLNVTACDIAYFHNTDSLAAKGEKDLDHAMESVAAMKEKYVFNYFKNLSELKNNRAQALADCTRDMKENPTHYIPVTLPALPFSQEQFDIVLSAHFLFTYSDRLDKDFHEKVVHELLRVAKQEVRIFPTVDLTGKRSAYLDDMIARMEELGHYVEEVKVPYEFQQNAHTMLKIQKKEQ